MPDLNLKLNDSLKSLGCRPRKRLGQNFMVNERLLAFMAESLRVFPGETVLEIGPGLGFLTRFLLREERTVIAVEKDRKLAGYLRQEFAGTSVRVVESDILKFDIYRVFSEEKPAKVIGNIPYYLTSPILEWLIERREVVEEAVLTLQYEVARRLLAGPGTKDWGALSVFVQTHARVKILGKVGKSAFRPAPQVDSAIVKLEFKKPWLVDRLKHRELFSRLVRKSFQKRRKNLLNALAEKGPGDFSKERLAEVLRRAGIDPRRRPETVSLAEWAKLSELF